MDGVEWATVADTPDLADEHYMPDMPGAADDPRWIEERRLARLRWLDERTQPDRREGSKAPPNDSRRGTDRRADPKPPRKLFGPGDESARSTGTSLRLALVVVLVVAIAAALLLWFVPQYAPTVRLLNRTANAQLVPTSLESGA